MEAGSRDAHCLAVVEQACIGWRKPLPVDRWRASLASANSTEQELLRAVDGLGATGTNADIPTLEAMVLDGTRTSSVRLSCARAIGRIAVSDQMPLAKKLRASTAEHAERLSVEVLAQSQVESSTEFLQDVALHGSPLAQRAAYRWLCERDAASARAWWRVFSNTRCSSSLARADANHRCQDRKDSPSSLRRVSRSASRCANGRAPTCLTCCSRTEEELQRVLTLLKPSMADADWRVLEQSIRLTVELHQNAYCERLMSLVDHARPEVCITACWALRNLAEDPAILGQMLEYVQKMTERFLDTKNTQVTEVQFRCTAHMFDAFGHRKFEPAKEISLRYVPKNFNWD